MGPPMEIDDERHRREEQDRRAKRKASKSSRSESQKEKDRKRREHTQRVLDQANKKHRSASTSPSKRSKPGSGGSSEITSSKFTALFQQRAQGFQMDFAFRNAPPRPPVGPCFVGLGLGGHLQQASAYKPHNAVEVNFVWKLHCEPDLGVPLAPSAMDVTSYKKVTAAELSTKPVPPEDLALLEWKGPMGDSAAEDLQKRRDLARRQAVAAASASPTKAARRAPLPKKKTTGTSKKAKFSRVLDENLPFYMKKTTYLSNDFGRKVHDFTSLAKTKEKEQQELLAKQRELEQGRSAAAISKSFDTPTATLVHPTKKKMKALWSVPLLPNVDRWGQAHTHVVVDNPPKNLTEVEALDQAFVAHVEQAQATARMTCQMLIPDEGGGGEDAGDDGDAFRSVSRYNLDVVPLKQDEEEPHTNFCFLVDKNEARYVPISSRVQLSAGRPTRQYRRTWIGRREPTAEEQAAEEALQGEVVPEGETTKRPAAPSKKSASGLSVLADDDDDDDEDDRFGSL